MLPYSLASPTFPFRALAALTGRLPLGGERELALATLMAARLASAAVPPHQLSAPARHSRAAGARVWFSTLTLPAAVRAPIARLLEATVQDDAATIASALTEVVTAAAPVLDRPARAELAGLVGALEAATPTSPSRAALS
jgi:hypothetical protein